MVLPGRVQEARAPAERRRTAGAVEQVAGDVLEVGVGLPVEVGHDRDVPVIAVELPEQGVDGGVDGGGLAEPVAPEGTHLDGPVGEGRVRPGADARVQELAGRGLGALDVGLVERVDAEQPPRDGRGRLPQEDLGPERTGDADERRSRLRGDVVRVRVGVGGDEPDDGAVVVEVRGLAADGDDREDAGAVLAGRLRDQLLGPGAEAYVLGAGVDEDELVAQGSRAAHRGAQAQRGVGVVVRGEHVGDRLRVVEEGLDVGAREAARAPARTR